MLKSDDQSMHRTTALHFVEYLETPPSMNGIPSLTSLLQARYTGTVLNLAICSKLQFKYSVSLQYVVFH